jgi:hypothetical protein
MRIGTFSAAVVVLSLAFACTAQGWSLKYASGPDPAVAEWPSWPYPTACLGVTFDPVAVFGGATEAENGSGAPELALRKYLDEGLYPQIPTKFWRVVTSGPTRVEFASGRLEQGLFWLSFDLVGGQWQLAGSLEECRARSVREGSVPIDWSLPRGGSLGPKSRQVEVKLHYKRGCDGGRGLNQAVEPEFRRVARQLVLTIWIKPLPPGSYTCEGRIEPPLALKLPGRLGKRRLWDGGSYPPRREF